MPIENPLAALAERWVSAHAAERANFQSYLIELCEALGVERPGPAGSGYQFELPVKVITRDGVETTNFIDCYRRDFFGIEAKDEEPGKSTDLLLRRAFGQVRNYVTYAPGGMPPFIMVMDVAKTLVVWDRWSGNYGDWHAGRRIDLRHLHERAEHADFLRAIWTEPHSLDPRARSQAVTKEVAGHLANLARSLEGEGYDQERVARFIMRCVFTMFAEDIGLLPGEPFRQVLDRCVDDPSAFPEQATDLWKAMDAGGRFEYKKLLCFNGHFFRDAEALPLSKTALITLGLAAASDWQHVEPAIFGTLLTRALDPKERHRLGAEFTPREFVERVVRPTVEQPIRERWVAEQAVVLQLREAGKKKEAEKRLRDFHDWMKGLRFLDPACGSGNFLYVTMHIVKRIELEVLGELEEVTGKRELLFDEVHPKQFFGIEIKPWAREIAELVLWIGYHQFWKAHHHHRPKEPILEDTGTIECRDAVLAYDEVRHDPTRDRPDPTPRIPHHVTGQLVPDPNVILRFSEHVRPHPADWPNAHFIIGNPPYVGNKRMRDVLGDGYVDALRLAYPDVPGSCDFVMYWWYRAANAIATRETVAAGLITTSSITQAFNRPVIRASREKGVAVRWAIGNHPWVDDADGADVRVAMTVLANAGGRATLAYVQDDGTITGLRDAAVLNDDLTAHADVPRAAEHPLLANEGIAAQGFKLGNAGFVVSATKATQLLTADPRNMAVLRPFVSGRDLTARPRSVYLIDFALLSEDEARKYALPFDIVRDTVLPERRANKRAARARFWWRFVEPNPNLRSLLSGVRRYIVTVEVSKHRRFQFVDRRVAPDGSLIVVGDESAFVLGVLSASPHIEWALAAGGRLGVGNDPRYNRKLCFTSYPFPSAAAPQADDIASRAEQLDLHRKAAIDRDKAVTMTGMYNVVEKLRSGEPLTEKERKIHEIAACGVLKDLHDELDMLVAKAYGWEWPLAKEVILERLVALHDERVNEEKAGKVRWLRPDYQIPRFGKGVASAASELGLDEATPAAAKPAKRPVWPADVISQIGAIKNLLASQALTIAEVGGHFSGARLEIIRRHLDILEVMGEVQKNHDGRYQGAA